MAPYKIAIDPGHGGRDPGAVGAKGLREADVVLAISLYLVDELKRTGQFEVMLTRESNQCLDLRVRGEMAAAWGAHLFISEHINATDNTKATGTEVFYSVDLPHTRQLAAELSATVAGILGIVDRGAKMRESQKYPGEDYYSVIDSAQDGGIPVVLLIESAFITNLSEEALLSNDSTLKEIARGQAKVITGYFGQGQATPELAKNPRDIRLIIKGKEMKPEVPPQVVKVPGGDCVMVPLRFIAEALGAKVHWDGPTRIVTID